MYNTPMIAGLLMLLLAMFLIIFLARNANRKEAIQDSGVNSNSSMGVKHERDRSESENLVMRIFTKLINLPVEKTDTGINYALKTLGEYEKTDSAFITLCHGAGAKVDTKYLWFAEGVPDFSEQIHNLRVGDFPLTAKAIADNGALIANNLENIPSENKREVESLLQMGIKSIIAVPLFDKNNLMGYMGFSTILENRCWSDDSLQLLKIMSISLANLITRKRADDALRESEERFRSLAMLSPDAIVVIQNEKIVFINDAGVELLGLSGPEDILEKNPVDFIHPDHLKSIKKRMESSAYKLRKPKYIEHIMIRADGREIIVETASTPMTYRGQPAVQAVGRDITERKRIENELHRQKELFIRMFKNHRSIMYMVDPMTLRIIDANLAAAKFYGYPQEKLAGMPLKDLNYMSDKEIKEEVNRAALEKRDYYIYKHKLADGRVRDVEVRSTPIMTNDAGQVYFTIVNDITDRVEAVEALRRSEERYRTLQDNVPVGLIRTNKAGKILSANRTLIEILHAPSEEELYRHNLIEIYADPSVRTEAIRRLSRESSLENLELELLRLDGTRMWALLSVRAIYDENGGPEYYDASVRDITAQKQAQDALKASEETYRNLFQNAQVGLFRTRIEDGRTLECNDQIARMFGYQSRHQAIDQYFTEDKYIDPDARQKMLDLLKKNGEFSNYEAELKRADSRTVWIRFSAKIYPEKGWLEGVAEDITQQKLTEIEMRKSEKKFKDLADLLPQTIFEIDLEGNFQYVNKFGLKLFGYTEEDLQKRINLFQLLSPSELEKARRNIQLRIKGKEPTEYEYTLNKKDGSTVYATIYASIIFHDDIPIGLRGIVVDLTEKRKVQEFINRAQRLETAGRIAGQVAHDINNLLGPLVAYPDLILEDLPPDHPIIPLVRDIKSSAKQLSEINQQLLTLGRRGNYNQDPMNLNIVVNQVLDQIFPMPPNLQIRKDLEPDLMNIMGGESQIMRVVLNLVTNALDAMQNIGLLAVSTGNVDLDSEIFGKWGRIPEGRYVKLTVSDTGCGISQEVIPKVFDPFFTTKKTDRTKGSGLGLSTVFAVVEDHHGFIDCETEAGKGTAFHVYFPVTFESGTVEPRDEITGGTEKILVVNSDREQRTVCLTLLNKLGYDANAVKNANTAAEFLKSHNIDLLLLDLDMEEDQIGAETYSRILEIDPSLKVVVVSGYSESDRITKAFEFGAVSVIHKPLTIKSLALGVRQALDLDKTETISSK